MRVCSLDGYVSVWPAFARAASFICGTDLASLADGRYEIDGRRVFMTIATSPMRPAEEAPLEAHDRYADIQIVLSGSETYGWADRQSLSSPRGEFDAAADIVFYDDSPTRFFTLQAGEMTVFMPSDAHAPLIGAGSVRKCIVKVEL